MKTPLLICVAHLVLSGCTAPDKGSNHTGTGLEDGVYPVVDRETLGSMPLDAAGIVELLEEPVQGTEDSDSQTVLVRTEPVLCFRDVVHHEFKFDRNHECQEIELENSESLRSFTRDHIGGRLAVVVGGKVVSSHKIRNPVETQNITITFCTEGGGDHVYRHLKKVLPPSTR